MGAPMEMESLQSISEPGARVVLNTQLPRAIKKQRGRQVPAVRKTIDRETGDMSTRTKDQGCWMPCVTGRRQGWTSYKVATLEPSLFVL